MNQLTPALVAGGILAILLEMIPGLNTAWSNLTPEQRQIINLTLVLVISLLFVVLPVVVAGEAWPEGWDWLITPLTVFFVTLAGNQTAHFGTRLVVGK